MSAAATKELKKRPRKHNQSLWKVLEKTNTIVQIFSQSSVAEVKALCKTISNTRRGLKSSDREKAVEDLLRALLPGVYTCPPDVRSSDRRPLQQLYAKMLPACSPQFVEEVVDARDPSNPLFRWRNMPKLIRRHGALFRRRAHTHLFGDATRQEDDMVHRTFLQIDKEFAIEALRGRLEGKITNKRWGRIDELDILLPIVHRLGKKRNRDDKLRLEIHALVKLGLEILAKNHKVSRNGADQLWAMALRGWKKRPDLYEDLVVLSMQLGLAGSQNNVPRAYLGASRDVSEGLRPRLLHLYCLHVPKKGVDIFTDESFAPLAKQSWPREVFGHVEAAKSIVMLKKLSKANPDFDFLTPPSGTSILRIKQVGLQHNFNVDLLLTILQRHDPDVQQNAKLAVNDLRRRAAVSRDPSERAMFAEAAAAYAIAIGDLDTYGDTVHWQQRFVHDTIPAQRLIGRQYVLTDEVVQLLSAIPDPEVFDLASSRLTAPLTLSSVRDRISKADGILKALYETCRKAKRSPSFQESDCGPVKALFRLSYKSRVSRMAYMQEKLKVQQSDIHSMVWKEVLSAIRWLDHELLDQVTEPIMDLLKASGPALLAAATGDLLELGAEHEMIQDRTRKEEILEKMSYEAVVMLARSDTPALASRLLVQTIMDRPDASAWHRKLLSIPFLKKLKAREAHAVLLNLAKAIGEKLEEQAYVKVGEAAQPEHAPPQSIVKVTTVKYLAQLLDNAEFISRESAVEILVELLTIAQHRDVRLAALHSLLALLESLCVEAQDDWADNETINDILCALEKIVPVAGSINERRPPRPEDWTEAETTGAIGWPLIADFEWPRRALPVLMEALLTALDGRRYPGLKVIQSAFVERIILPTIRKSQSQHRQWVDLFLAKRKAPFSSRDIPPAPLVPFACNIVLLSHYPLVWDSLLQDFSDYALNHIAPKPQVKQFNSALQAEIAEQGRMSLEAMQWISVYDPPRRRFEDFDTATLLQILNTKWDARLRVDYKPLLDGICQHATLYLDDYQDYAGIWGQFMAALGPKSNIISNPGNHAQWREKEGVVVQHIIQQVKTRKAQEQNHILPSTFRQQLWLLSFPAADGADESYRSFVGQLEDLLLAQLQEEEGQIFRCFDMAGDVCTVLGLFGNQEERYKVAYELGKLSVREKAEDGGSVLQQAKQGLDLIKVEVATKIFDGCRDEKGIKDGVAERLKEWETSNSSVVREKAFQLKVTYSKKRAF
ncbi:hypothetical protein M406DRAFT_256038 [Cryphonectria parasitica EP155]|uniref:Uncharacterized protein n=1 Tax=Cryphonectria parasitica (strain ATCC 38755 / EP155) TaxID=660469 RepID=A0A9P4Y3Q1_CRYP1|nr:uncharacterized protein M406DRAFT_256038 [Cryphonectria parasitica EP155]KAF3766374.1 hypothetical protein M406DRAFT_256038 [Cryphonectria parasitica EP155]